MQHPDLNVARRDTLVTEETEITPRKKTGERRVTFGDEQVLFVKHNEAVKYGSHFAK